MNYKQKKQVICAITGDSINRSDAVEVGLFFEDGSNQGLFISKERLNELLYESIPRHPDLMTKDNIGLGRTI